MTNQFCSIIKRATQVAVQDTVIATSGAQECIVPGDSADTTIMTSLSSNDLALGRVPNLKLASMSSNCEMLSVTGPLNACDTIVGSKISQF